MLIYDTSFGCSHKFKDIFHIGIVGELLAHLRHAFFHGEGAVVEQSVGIVDVVNFNPQHLRAEIGIVIVCQHRHKGYARAAIEKIIDYARSVWHLHQLYVIIDCRNSIARSMFESMGFKADKVLADWLWDGKNYHDACMMQNIL